MTSEENPRNYLSEQHDDFLLSLLEAEISDAPEDTE